MTSPDMAKALEIARRYIEHVKQWQPYETRDMDCYDAERLATAFLSVERREKKLREALVNVVNTSAEPVRRTSNMSPLTRHPWLKALHEARAAPPGRARRG